MNTYEVVEDMLDLCVDIKRRNPTNDYEIHMSNLSLSSMAYVFDQTWASTALGFGGCGGDALTTRPTYVLIPDVNQNKAFVYFDGMFAYECCVNDGFRKDLENKNMASIQVAATRYK